MTRQLVQLLIGSLALWALLALPAWLMGGDTALLDTVIACGLCLVPMALTLVWSYQAFRGSAEQQLASALGGAGLRIVVVLAGGIGLFQTVAWLNRPAFLLWLVVFYLATLTLEVALIVRRQNAVLAQSNNLGPGR